MPSNYSAITNNNNSRLGSDTASRKSQISIFVDPTQFVYEIIKNADECGATEITFELLGNGIVIEHNGEPFTPSDVEGITYFGRGVESEDLVKTGSYGIGFKSVFAITATPIIISKDEHFKIYDLYRLKVFPYPDGYDTDTLVEKMSDGEIRYRTRIILPFNHLSEKPDYVEEFMTPEENYKSIVNCFHKLNTNSLLFLDSVARITWNIYDTNAIYIQKILRNGEIIHIDVNEEHITNIVNITPIDSGSIYREKNNDVIFLMNTHFLRFDKIVEINTEKSDYFKECNISIAFEIKELENEWKILPIDEGQVYIYFPAKKEYSGLRFHLRAPFVTNAARDSIKDCIENYQLRDHLTDLIAESLNDIRDKGLLNIDFFEVLPNKLDRLPGFYSPIQERIIEEFKNKDLLPMKQGGYSSAYEAFKNSKSTKDISNLIKDEDLIILLNQDNMKPMWIKNPKINSRSDKFISMLEIEEWTIDQLLEKLHSNSDIVERWLREKSQEWHKKFYELLSHFISKKPFSRNVDVAKYIVSTRGLFQTDCAIDNDPSPSIAKSKLIWQTMLFLNEHTKIKDSTEIINRQNLIDDLYLIAVKKLIRVKWIPQIQNKTISSEIEFVIPRNASVDYLPDGFPYEASQDWLKEIDFGVKYKKEKEKSEKMAEKLTEISEKLDIKPDELLTTMEQMAKYLKDNNITIEDLIAAFENRK